MIISNEGKDRSLCANLAASTKFSIEHVKKSDNADLIKKADYYYVTVSIIEKLEDFYFGNFYNRIYVLEFYATPK